MEPVIITPSEFLAGYYAGKYEVSDLLPTDDIFTASMRDFVGGDYSPHANTRIYIVPAKFGTVVINGDYALLINALDRYYIDGMSFENIIDHLLERPHNEIMMGNWTDTAHNTVFDVAFVFLSGLFKYRMHLTVH